MMPTYTLSVVLGAAYPKGYTGPFLIHAIDSEGHAVCGKVKDEHLAEYAPPETEAPTCKACLKAWRKAGQ